MTRKITCVHKHQWLPQGRAEILESRKGKRGFSHNESLPLMISVVRKSWWKRKVYVTTTEEVWYQDAVVVITIPPLFNSDLASVPRVFWLFVSPWDIALESLFHDMNYREQQISREFADFLLRDMMRARGVPWLIRWVIYLALRMFGGAAWKAHARRRALEKKADAPK